MKRSPHHVSGEITPRVSFSNTPGQGKQRISVSTQTHLHAGALATYYEYAKQQGICIDFERRCH